MRRHLATQPGLAGIRVGLPVAAASDPTPVVPPQPRDGQSGDVTFRGFELGTWDDRDGLPPGCRYGDFGDGSKTLVLCDLAASDVFGSLNDPKEACRAAYGNNVVVHVPLPAEAITCNPPSGPLGDSCGASWSRRSHR